jgi:integrase
MAGRRSSFGQLDKLPSGRWRARYVWPPTSKTLHAGPVTYQTRMDAQAWLSLEHQLIVRDEWMPPKTRTQAKYRKGATLAEFSPGWLAAHKRKDGEPLKDRTREHYQALLDGRILLHLGEMPMRHITEDVVRDWLDVQLPQNTPVANAHAYALLCEILKAAARKDTAIKPPQIDGAAKAKTKHKAEPATVEELAIIVENMPEKHRLLVLLMAWCALRFGEATELRRKDLVLGGGNPRIKVRRGVVLVGGERKVTTPKSDAGDRDVTIPPHLVPQIQEHLARFAQPGLEGLIFPSESGGHLAQSTLNGKPGRRRRIKGRMVNESASGFCKAREAAGRPDLHIHDLRHTGATLAALTGATIAELMERLGHSTPAAAMRYQHVARGRAKAIAEGLSVFAEARSEGVAK